MRSRLAIGAAGFFALTVILALGPRAIARGHRDHADASGPLDLLNVSVDQVRRSVRISVRTSGSFYLGALNRHPDTNQRRDRFICLQLHKPGHKFMRQLCFGKGPNGDDDTLGYAVLKPDKSVRSWVGIDARVKRPNGRSVVATFRPGAAHLHPGHYRWRAVSQWTGNKCPDPGRTKRDPCFDRVPNGHDAAFQLHDVQPVGCRDSGPSPRFAGPTSGKRVALTFDDGPSTYTPQVLSILQHHHVKATFFEIGEQVSSASAAVIKAGDELADHSYHHETDPSRSSMAATNARIRSATGFEPCLFRPPGGAYNSRVVSDARALGMTTVLWNVDPRDWSRPGTDAIYSRVVSATRPGSIVLMHDGGGDRSETVAALPRIIKTLRSRGYHFVTVSKLFGQRTIWGQAPKSKARGALRAYLNSPAGSAPATKKPE
jgi:peptidoglycan/xylan/chitin deacetylase (PgdA/CDA1 family)